MKFSLIICTFKRPGSLFRLLRSVEHQEIYPDEILIIDSSPDSETKHLLRNNEFKNLDYYKVSKEDSGLTRQRNYGVKRISQDCEIVCFLDDDVILDKKFFKELIRTYQIYPEALAVSGYITNDVEWQKIEDSDKIFKGHFNYDGWSRIEGSRFGLRRKFGLAPDKAPGIMPDFSHGYSTAFLPPSNKIYEVEMLMGGISSYKTKIFNEFSFSEYFEGYGLYEDADFSLRLAKKGKLYVNTAARLEHHHDSGGRPNYFEYGKMVLRNGFYVWRIKYQKPTLKAYFKWHATALLLTGIRFSNVLTNKNKKKAFSEGLGRLFGWVSLFLNAPKPNHGIE